ncbi:MAG: polysaccharide deacetylase family protein [Bacillota bacterium]|nr:polysaccharide deacetylase family protein [Bacillota bacterium]
MAVLRLFRYFLVAVLVSLLACLPVVVQAGPGGAVREYQSLLEQLGYYRGSVDGIAGPLTRTAVVRFQRDHGLTPDGVVGPATLSALRRAAATYVVRKGDNLSTIAARYGVTVSWLCRVNGIKKPDLIRPGQKLIVRDLPGVTSGQSSSGKTATGAGNSGGSERTAAPGSATSGKGAGKGEGPTAGQGKGTTTGQGNSAGQGTGSGTGTGTDTVSGWDDPAWETFLPGVGSPGASPPSDSPGSGTGPQRTGGGLRGARIALTFNDAPHENAAAILDVLARRGVTATFFLIGDRVGSGRDQVRAMVAAGHQIGNHSYGHRPLAGHSLADVEKDLGAAQAAIKAASGQVPRYFRPPGGVMDRTVASAAARQGLTTVLWHNVGLTDDLPLPPEELARRIAARCRDGYIVMLHADRPTTAAVVDHLIGLLTAAGARLVTLSELGAP